MKICSNCAASNLDSAAFCDECGANLKTSGIVRMPTPGSSQPTLKAPGQITPGKLRSKRIELPLTIKAQTQNSESAQHRLNADALAQTLSARLHSSQWLSQRKRADIMFILDCTESMKGEIQAIKDVIVSFVETIESEGVRVRVGLVEFRDRLINEEHRVLTFNGEVFTNNPQLFQEQIARLQATGGGDEPESSLDAILFALQQPFASDSQKVLVLITDAPPHIPDKEIQSIEQIVKALHDAALSQLYLVIPILEDKNQIYLQICAGQRAMVFDLGKEGNFRERADHFKKTLMSLGKTITATTT